MSPKRKNSDFSFTSKGLQKASFLQTYCDRHFSRLLQIPIDSGLLGLWKTNASCFPGYEDQLTKQTLLSMMLVFILYSKHL